MAVTGNFYNTLEFGNVNSGDYGVYITGTGAYNAPARAVEMVSVPGRNGDVAIDMGHWDNIEVTYKCGLFGVDQSEMGEALMEFRNAIASQIGYQRLSDSYNPNEFRLGLFMAGLEFDAVSRNRAGEFELKFNCKPQRFLTDGEEMIDVKSDWSDLKTASGDVVTFEVEDDAAANYTQFKSLVADIEPQQDLNGYDHPWVGGAGKNLVNPTLLTSKTNQGVAITPKESDPIISLSGTASGAFNYYICPTGSNVVKSNAGFVLPAGTYTFSARKQDGSALGLGGAIGAFYWEGESDSRQIVQANNNNVTSVTVTSSEALYITPTIGGVSGAATDFDVYFQIELGSTATEWTPYENLCPISGWDSVEVVVSPTTSVEDGTTYTATFDETVYGGTVDLVSGVLTVDRAYVDLGTLTWTVYGTAVASTNRFGATLTAQQADATHPTAISSAYSLLPTGGTFDANETGFTIASSRTIFVYDANHKADDAATFKTAMNGVQLVYELATPQTYQLDPQTINTLVGVNNVWANSGDVTLEYGVRPGVLVNPTQYESQPLIEVAGSGLINLNDYTINIVPETYGRIDPVTSTEIDRNGRLVVNLNSNMYLEGDKIMLDSAEVAGANGWPFIFYQQLTGTRLTLYPELASHVESGPITSAQWTESGYITKLRVTAEFTAGQSELATAEATYTVYKNGTSLGTMTAIFYAHYYSRTSGDYIELSTGWRNDTGDSANNVGWTSTDQITATINADSSKSVIDGVLYIDSETGDAYVNQGGTYISLNKYIQLGAQLPSLRPGANVITYDDTITSLKIAPRWWRL